ncbi:reverse transcriptase domain-containing protein [Enterobacter ludwigii]
MMLNHPTPDDRAAGGAYGRMMQAWQWLCEQRRQAPDHADVWHIRWQHLNTGEGWLTALTERVLRGEYRLTPLQLHGRHEDRKAVWSAQDALVLKWTALSLQHLLPLHPSCEHVKGHGGGKQSIEKLHSLLTAQSVDSEKKTATSTTPDAAERRPYKWVCRTDIRGYYRNINKQSLIAQVNQHVTSPVLRDLTAQYVHYIVEDGGTFHTPDKGISRGCPLSPLMGALHLFDMDEHFSNQPNIHYARYMDDIIILAKSRWSLRKHTKRLMQWFGEYGFEAHPDKTQIGRTEKGFDWMGAWLTHEGMTDIVPRAKASHCEKVRRLYEQLGRLPKWKRKSAAPEVHARVSTYRKRWNIWSCMLMIASLSAQADRPIIVLSPNLPPGTVLPGGDFHTSIPADYYSYTPVTTSTNYNSAANLTYNADGSYISSVGKSGGGAEWGVPVPGTSYYGIRITASDVYLVPIAGMIGVCRGPNNCLTMRLDPTRKQLCGTTIEGTSNAILDQFHFQIDTSLVCRMVSTYKLNSGLYQDYGVYADVTLRPFAGNNPKEGETSLTGFYVGDGGHQTAKAMDKPTAIVVSGLQCNLSAPPAIDFNVVEIASTANKIVASADANKLSLKLTCTGRNTTDATVPLGYVLTPAGTGVARASGGLGDPNQPSFYMNFTNNGTPSCQPSSSSSIKLDGMTSQRITTVSPGQSITETQLNIGSALCSTGTMTQLPGSYEMAITASLVSY